MADLHQENRAAAPTWLSMTSLSAVNCDKSKSCRCWDRGGTTLFGWMFVRILMTLYGIEDVYHVFRKDLNLNYEISPKRNEDYSRLIDQCVIFVIYTEL